MRSADLMQGGPPPSTRGRGRCLVGEGGFLPRGLHISNTYARGVRASWSLAKPDLYRGISPRQVRARDGNFRTSTRARYGVHPKQRANMKKLRCGAKTRRGTPLSSITNFERKEEQAVYALPEPRRHVHRAAHAGRFGALP